MLGFVIGISQEFSSGQSIFSQVCGGGGWRLLAVILAVTAASFAPALRGVPVDEVLNQPPPKSKILPKEFGPFNQNAELNNGRIAMIALAVILLLEGVSSSAFFI